MFKFTRSQTIRYLRAFSKFNYWVYGTSLTATCYYIYRDNKQEKEDFFNKYPDAIEPTPAATATPAQVQQQ